MSALSALAIGAGAFVFAVSLFSVACFVRAEMKGELSEKQKSDGGFVIILGLVSLFWVGSWMIVRWLA